MFGFNGPWGGGRNSSEEKKINVYVHLGESLFTEVTLEFQNVQALTDNNTLDRETYFVAKILGKKLLMWSGLVLYFTQK